MGLLGRRCYRNGAILLDVDKCSEGLRAAPIFCTSGGFIKRLLVGAVTSIPRWAFAVSTHTVPKNDDPLQHKYIAREIARFDESTAAITSGKNLIAEFSLIERRARAQW